MKQKLRSEIVDLIQKKQIFEEYAGGGMYYRCTYEELLKAILNHFDIEIRVKEIPHERKIMLEKKGK